MTKNKKLMNKIERPMKFVIFILCIPFIVGLLQYLNQKFNPYEWRSDLFNILAFIDSKLDYFGTVSAIIFAVYQFISEQKERTAELERNQKERNEELERKEKERNEELKRNQKEIIELKKKELNEKKNYYRPTFVRVQNQDYIEVVMKSDNLYIRNVRFYNSDIDRGKDYYDLKNGDKIKLGGINNNYFVTAETIIGEKILFGNILNNVQVYKVLKEEGMPILPSDFNKSESDLSAIINNHWESYNEISSEEKDLQSNINNVDMIFMFRTMIAREKLVLNTTEYLKDILKVESMSELLTTILRVIDLKTFGVKNISAVLNEFLEILKENMDSILINLKKMTDSDIYYCEKQMKKSLNNSIDKEEPAIYIFNKYYAGTGTLNKDDYRKIIAVYLKLSEIIIINGDNKKYIDTKITEYKDRILNRLEN